MISSYIKVFITNGESYKADGFEYHPMVSKITRIFIFILAALFQPLDAQFIDLDNELVLKLPMNGDAIDQSINNIPTNPVDPVLTTDRDDNQNAAYVFDGVDDFINVNNDQPIITNTSFSIVMWVKIDGKSKAPEYDNTIFEQRDDDAAVATSMSIIHFSAELDDNIYFALRSSEHSKQPLTPLTCATPQDGDWHHYAAIKNDNLMSIYLDASLCASYLYSEPGDFVTSIDHVNLGVHTYSGSIKGALNGSIDDVYIYNRAINECEILYLYKGSLPEER